MNKPRRFYKRGWNHALYEAKSFVFKRIEEAQSRDEVDILDELLQDLESIKLNEESEQCN